MRQDFQASSDGDSALTKRMRELPPGRELENLQFLVEKKWVNEGNFTDHNVRSVLINAKPDNLKLLVEKEWVNEGNFTDPNVRYVLACALPGKLEIIAENGFNILADYVDTGNLTRNVLSTDSIDLYTLQKLHPLTLAFAPFEDYVGDIVRIDEQVRYAIAKLEESNGTSFNTTEPKEQMRQIIDYFVSGAGIGDLNDVDIMSKKENVKQITKQRTGEESEKNTLYLYIRQGHGEMCSMRATLIARALWQYIESGKSRVFTQIKIVPYNYSHPSSIHLFGMDVLNVIDDEFRRLKNGGDIMGLTHFNSNVFTGPNNVPCVTVATAVNPSKMSPDAHVLPLLFDVRDLGAENIPVNPEGTSRRDRRLPDNLLFGEHSSEDALAKIVKNSQDLGILAQVVISGMRGWEDKILEKAGILIDK